MSSVDTSIHDRTTGAAATLASNHAFPAVSRPSTGEPQYLTLYGSWFCPFVQRTWIVLHELNMPHQYIEINPYKKEKHFLDLNPRGLVPTLAISATKPAEILHNNKSPQHPANEQEKEEEKVLYESSVLVDYLDQTYSPPPTTTSSSSSSSQPYPPFPTTLYPLSPYSRAHTRIWIDHISSRIVPSFYRFLQHTPASNYTLESAREEFVRGVYTFAAALPRDSSGPFFNGEQFGMVEVMFAPWAARIFLLEHYKDSSGIPSPRQEGRDNGGGQGNAKVEGQAQKWEEEDREEEARVWDRWHVWFDAVMARESVRYTLSDKERYVDVYKRYAEDKTGSQVGIATRSGRGLP